MELSSRRRKAKGHIRLSLRKVLQPLAVRHCSFQSFKAMRAKRIFQLQTSCWPSFRVNVIVSQFFSFQGVWRQKKTVPMCPFSYDIWAFLNCPSLFVFCHKASFKLSWKLLTGCQFSELLLSISNPFPTFGNRTSLKK